MGAWSAEPFGNDEAADWAWELDDTSSWDIVLDALTAVVIDDPAAVDEYDATIAVAAAEVVAHGLGRPTQSDAYTESVVAFVERAPAPPAGSAERAISALDSVCSPGGELAELWRDGGSDEWSLAVARLRESLTSVD